ncbi:MAG: hypothetical protein WCY27_01045 [archaeon]|jgi:hypothetical protein|nr:hypothetical protein [archaeon]MDD2477635.1 hypothetical protein [Candidatus ainarchaeum sp.]MDD3084270.1 hypothetical protein [Candidatus ainarchaeum sp.]MDD4221011.1 hypothetical protein [Candidatus ainarchaeum sp.]MDD4662483.1 hypothetical protein [Candidatus ainarchaeum sp.]
MRQGKEKIKEHKFNQNILLVSFLLLLIVMIAIYSGIVLYDKYKKSEIQDDFTLLNQQILLNDLYNSYLSDVNSQDLKCEVLNKQISSQLKINEELFERLRLINKNAIVETDNSLKYMYVLTNIRLWLQYNKVNKDCNIDNETVLFFYPEIAGHSSQKAISDAQTKIFEHRLAKLLEKCKYRSIALPYLDYIPVLDQIIKDYNVTSAPAVYINGKIYYELYDNYSEEFLQEFGCGVEK